MNARAYLPLHIFDDVPHLSVSRHPICFFTVSQCFQRRHPVSSLYNRWKQPQCWSALVHYPNCDFAERFSWTATDVNHLAAAREWSRNSFVPQAAESLSKSYLRRIDQLPLPGKRFDLVVRVMHVSQQNSAGQLIVIVWDGTDMPSIAFQNSGQLGLSAPSARAHCASGVPDLVPPAVGDLVELRVPVGERAVVDTICALKTGDWIKVRNMHSVYDSERGLVHLQICPDSALYTVPRDANVVLALLTHSEERIQG